VVLEHDQLPDEAFWMTEPVDAPFHLCEAHGTGQITGVGDNAELSCDADD
jgi:hypothetical protein